MGFSPGFHAQSMSSLLRTLCFTGLGVIPNPVALFANGGEGSAFLRRPRMNRTYCVYILGGWPQFQFAFELDFDRRWCEIPTRSDRQKPPIGDEITCEAPPSPQAP